MPPPQPLSPGQPRPIGIGLVGLAFMGAAHSHAWRTVNRVWDLPLQADLVALCGRDPDRTATAADHYGFASFETDWRALLERDDVQLVDICTPGDTHAEIAIAALRAGKHVLCEKPLANDVASARAMADAARSAADAGVLSMCGYTYRRVPALALFARLVAQGRVGRIFHIRARYLQDWLVDPAAPLTWRLQAERAGLGALGDIGSHIVDLAQYLTGHAIVGVNGLTSTFVTERPLVDDPHTTGPVTVDDTAAFVARTDGGALATFEATRFATGRKNALRIEVNGELGSLAFDLERLNELEFYDRREPAPEQGFRRILVTQPDHPYLDAWWPPGHVLGWEHAFVHQAGDLLTAIADGIGPRPSFTDALQVQLVLDAVARSAARDGAWTPVSG